MNTCHLSQVTAGNLFLNGIANNRKDRIDMNAIKLQWNCSKVGEGLGRPKGRPSKLSYVFRANGPPFSTTPSNQSRIISSSKYSTSPPVIVKI